MRVFNRSFERTAGGDTIVEVLVSITILALVLSVTFVSTSRSLRQGSTATNRQQATSYAQQQVELIKNAATISSAALSKYESAPGTAFCINPANVGSVGSNYGYQAATGTGCKNISGRQYTVSDTYNNSNGLFTVNTSWPGPTSINASNNDQLTVYYKVPQPGAYVPATCPVGETGTPPACVPTAPSCPVGETGTPPACVPIPPAAPTIGPFTANPNPVNYGAAAVFSWTSTNATSCAISGALNASGLPPNSSGSPSTGPLTSPATYTLTCTGPGGSTASPPLTVFVNALPPGGEMCSFDPPQDPTFGRRNYGSVGSFASPNYLDTTTCTWFANPYPGSYIMQACYGAGRLEGQNASGDHNYALAISGAEISDLLANGDEPVFSGEQPSLATCTWFNVSNSTSGSISFHDWTDSDPGGNAFVGHVDLYYRYVP